MIFRNTLQNIILCLLLLFCSNVKAQCPVTISATSTSASGCEGTAASVTATITSPVTPPTQYSGQVNPNPNIFVPDGSLSGISSTITIGGAPPTGPTSFIQTSTDVTTLLNIPANICAEADVYLVGPGNCGALELFTDVGGNGKNFISTNISTNFTATLASGIAPFTGNFAPEGTISTVPNFNSGVGGVSYLVPSGPIPVLANNDLVGCPINGVWTLWVFDDAGLDSIFLDNWTLNIGNCGYSYNFGVPTGSVITGFTVANNTMNATATYNNLPIGLNTIPVTISNGTATTITNVVVKNYDLPVITQVVTAPNCISGNNGSITVTAPAIINANFTGADIGVFQYSINNVNWQTSNVFTGLSAGNYTVLVRNSASTSCIASQIVVLISNPIFTPSNGTNAILQCDAVSGANNVSLSGQSTGGPPGVVNFNFFEACSGNCIIPDANISCPPFTDAILVTGAGGSLITATTVISVTLNIPITFTSDLDIMLVGPANCGTLELMTDVGGGSDNITNITLTTASGFPSINTATSTGGFLQSNATFQMEGGIEVVPTLLPPYSNTPCFGANPSFFPLADVLGCPVNGAWTLVVTDDLGIDIGTLVNWTLNIAQSDPFYTTTMSTTEPGVTLSAIDQIPSPATTVTGATISFNGSGPNAFLAPAQAQNLPIGITEVLVTSSRGGCVSDQKTIIIKVFARPENFTFSGGCASAGNPAIVSFSATLDNADFTGADVGVVQYATSLSGPWLPITTNATLAAGSYSYYLRNSASPGTSGANLCSTGPFPVVIATGIVPVITLNNPAVNCNQTTVNLTATLNSGYTPSYLWTTTQTTQTIAITPVVPTQYCVTVTNSANTACTATKCQTITPTFTGSGPAPIAQGDSVCISGNVVLSVVSACVGGSLNWYTTPTGGTSIFTGNPFNTSISSTTNYYVECVQGPCVSARALVSAMVFPLIATPTITVFPNPACNDQDPLFTVTSPLGVGLYVYQWYVNGSPVAGATAPSWTWTTPVDGALVTVEALYSFP